MIATLARLSRPVVTGAAIRRALAGLAWPLRALLAWATRPRLVSGDGLSDHLRADIGIIRGINPTARSTRRGQG
jgi:hypothetical protein